VKYSVLMSVYHKDSPEFLKLALESIYEKQTRRPDEIVVIFDGPLHDSLYAVLDAFAEDKREVVRYYPQEVNRGLGEALRIGAEKCTGDYIFRMDSDDISMETRFEKQIAYLEAHPETDVLGTATAEFFESIDEQKRQICRFPSAHEDLIRMAKRRNPMNHMTVCMRRDALLSCGSYQSLLLMEDYYLWVRMMVAGYRFANLEEPLVHVRVGNGFYARRSSSVQIKSWKQLQNYMVEHKFIGKAARLRNMITVYGFVYMPAWLKKPIYKIFMRK